MTLLGFPLGEGSDDESWHWAFWKNKETMKASANATTDMFYNAYQFETLEE